MQHNQSFTPVRAPLPIGEPIQHLRQPKTPDPSLLNSNCAHTRTSTKLSPNAIEFKPALTSGEQYMPQQHQQQTQHYRDSNWVRQPPQQQYYDLQQQQQQQHHQQQNQQQRFQSNQYNRHQQHSQQSYSNGTYDWNYRNQQQQQPRHHHQQQQRIEAQVNALSGSVQNRLNISGVGAGAEGVAGSSSYTNSPSSSKHIQHNNQNSNHNNHSAQKHRSNSQRTPFQNTGVRQEQSDSDSAANMEKVALDYLATVIECLSENPGQFDSIASHFLTIFEGMEDNQTVLSIAMDEIFEKSILNSNFRYMGAKLYNLLHMLNLNKNSLFHTLLNCQLSYHQEQLQQYMQQNQLNQVRDTALFLAELYMQLRGDDTRIQLIAENIVLTLKQLLTKENADNVRCVCLTLKLAGFDLTHDCPQDMQDIIRQLEDINQRNPGKYLLAANVIALQRDNWGRKMSNSTSSTSEDEEKRFRNSEKYRSSDEPIFYGPDGRELTAEESDFLTYNINGGNNGGPFNSSLRGYNAEDDIDLDPEMDEEAERAYEEFCRQNAAAM